MNLIPINKLKDGSININIAANGSSLINKAYVGSSLSLVRFSEYPRLKVDVDSVEFGMNGGTSTVTVATNASWSAATTGSWFTIATASTGFTITADANPLEEVRNGVITVTAWNVDAAITSSITLTQAAYTPVHYLQYIYYDQGSTSDSHLKSIATPIYPSDDCEMTVEYMARGIDCDRIVGVSWADRTDASDSKDFRVFNFGGGSLDVNSERWSSLAIYSDYGKVYNLTVGNAFIYDNLNQTYKTNNSQQRPLAASDTLIHVDVGVIKLKSLQIKNGGVVVFDGKAAYDPATERYGLWDEVTGQLYTAGEGYAEYIKGDELT